MDHLNRGIATKLKSNEDGAVGGTSYQLLTFRLGIETYAFDVSNVREILEYAPIAPIPKMPSWICGVINLRGSVIPVVELSTKLGLPRQPNTVNTCIVIVELRIKEETCVLGVLVDAVQEVFEMDETQLKPRPALGSRLSTEFIEGMGMRNDRIFLILNVERLFSTFDTVVDPKEQNTALPAATGVGRNV